MERLKNIGVSRLLLMACFVVYLVNTTVKMCVPTVISSMVGEGFLTKSQSGFLSGIFYLFYGIGQIIFGKYFNNHSPYRGIKTAMIGSALCCIAMALTKDFYLLVAIWSICALVNSAFFPAMMRIASLFLYERHSVWASNYLAIAYQAGTVLCLVAGSIIIKYSSWVNLYYFSTVISALSLIFWFIAERKAKKSSKPRTVSLNDNKRKTENSNKKSLKAYIGTGIYLISAVAFFNSLLNGVKSWAPTIIMETYKTPSSFSVLLNVVIIVTNIVFLLVTGRIIPRDRVKTVAYFEVVIIPVTLLMNFTGILNEYTYVLLLGLFTSVTTYASNAAAMQIPYYFSKYNDVSRMSGIGNMCAAFGLLVGNYAYGILAEYFGWQIITILGTVFVVISAVLLFIAAPMFRKFIKQ